MFLLNRGLIWESLIKRIFFRDIYLKTNKFRQTEIWIGNKVIKYISCHWELGRIWAPNLSNEITGVSSMKANIKPNMHENRSTIIGKLSLQDYNHLQHAQSRRILRFSRRKHNLRAIFLISLRARTHIFLSQRIN